MDTSSLDSRNDFSIEDDTRLKANTCSICKNRYVCPKILDCLHLFCEECIFEIANVNSTSSIINIVCPTCNRITIAQFKCEVLSLPPDYVTRDIIEFEMLKNHVIICKFCDDYEKATHKCITCCEYFCSSCEKTHMMSVKLEQHHYMTTIGKIIKNSENNTAFHKMVLCEKHNNEKMVYYCNKCDVLACDKCLNESNPTACQHRYDSLSNAYKKYGTELGFFLRKSKNVMKNVSTLPATLEKELDKLQVSHVQIKLNVEETFHSFNAILETCKREVLEELESAQKQQQQKIMDKLEEVKKITDYIGEVQKFTTRLFKNGSKSENLALKKLIFTRMRQLFVQIPDVYGNAKLLYNPEISGFENYCRKYFGHIETVQDMNSARRPISLPNPRINFLTDHAFSPPMVDSQMFNLNLENLFLSEMENNSKLSTIETSDSLCDSLNTPTSLDDVTYLNNLRAFAELNNSNNDNNMLQSLVSPLSLNQMVLDPFSVDSLSSTSSSAITLTPDMRDFPTNSNWHSKNKIHPLTLPKRHSSRTSLSVIATFGKLGSGPGEFHLPTGFCLSPTGDIVVVDTMNHRIQVLEKNGRYKTGFGKKGIVDGCLFFPRKVVFLSQNQIAICDRGPNKTRVQIFEFPTGKFVKKIYAGFIQMVGAAINGDGHIVLIGFYPIIYVLNVNGNDSIIKRFDCAQYVKKPSDILVRNENYFVCDYKGHSVVVFNDQGIFLRSISDIRITYYPFGMDISENGEILVGDTYGNRLHVAVFSESGTYLRDLLCRFTKVSHCYGLKISSDGHIIILSKKSHQVFIFH